MDLEEDDRPRRKPSSEKEVRSAALAKLKNRRRGGELNKYEVYLFSSIIRVVCLPSFLNLIFRRIIGERGVRKVVRRSR